MSFLLGVLPRLTGQERLRNNGYVFENFTEEFGLPETGINVLLRDSRGYLWLGPYYRFNGLIRYDGYQFTVFQPAAGQAGAAYVKDRIVALAEDAGGKIWAATQQSTVYTLDPVTGAFHIYAPPLDSRLAPLKREIMSLVPAGSDAVWAGSRDGLLLLRERTGPSGEQSRLDITTFPVARRTASPDSINGRMIGALYRDREGTLWLGTGSGLSKVLETDTAAGRIRLRHYVRGDGLACLMVTALARRSAGGFYVAGVRGTGRRTFQAVLQYFDPFSGAFRTVPFSLPENTRIGVLREDQEGNLWVGTWGQGVHRLSFSGEESEQAPKRLSFDFDLDKAPQQNMVHDLTLDNAGNIWFATRFKVLKFNPDINCFEFVRIVSSKENAGIAPLTLAQDRSGNVWVGTMNGGLFRYDPAHRTLTAIPRLDSLSIRIENNYIMLLADRQNGLWLGMQQGVFRYDLETERITAFPEISEKLEGQAWIHSLLEDSAGRIWIGSYGRGVVVLDPQTGAFRHYLPRPSDPAGLGGGNVCHVYQDRLGRRWVTGRHGLQEILSDPVDSLKLIFRSVPELENVHLLWMYQDHKGRFWLSSMSEGLIALDRDLKIHKRYHWREGFTALTANMIFEDGKGYLWLFSRAAVFRFDPEAEIFKMYGPRQGVLHSPGGRYGGFVGDGKMWTGAGREGFYIFDPAEVKPDTNAPKVYITDIKLFEESLVPGENAYLKAPPGEATILRLPHHQNSLTFAYAGLHFDEPEKNTYRYRMVGVDDGWVPARNERSARYAQMPPGNYTFQVSAANGDGVWSEAPASINLEILPPWWATRVAYALYLLAALGLLYRLYRFLLRRQLQLAETRRLRELDEVRTRLYTNITHEFRTPLTVIQGFSDLIRNAGEQLGARQIAEHARRIRRNSVQLLQLVNQMLDLSKLESGNLPVNLVQGDILPYLKYLLESFHSLAEGKDIRLHFLNEEETLVMDYDPEKIWHIVSNLISNAIKYTDPGGDVYLSTHTRDVRLLPEAGDSPLPDLELRVRDNGIGIASHELPHIFDRFYQVDDEATRKASGTGIGLTLTRELVKLLDGEIAVESQPGQGTVFTVWLPIRRTAERIEDEPEAPLPLAPAVEEEDWAIVEGPGERPKLLIIEDNHDVVAYLASCFQDQYRIAVALNGAEGIAKALEVAPDIIVSDVMMPEKDGYEVCETLKEDVHTSHIPIILLTAKADQDARVAGLKYGADAYLTKPFDKKELEVRLEKLLESRRRLQARYASFDAVPEDGEKFLSREERFLKDLRNTIEENLADDGFGIAELCASVGMSRSQLHNKTKALTGKSASILIRTVRLEKAKELLRRTDLNISEVAYEVGFRTPVYFTQVFTKEFGMPPSEFRISDEGGVMTG